MHPLVSVVIPMYNAANTIEATFQSVVNQTYTNIEIVIVNDGSTDESVEIVKRLVSQCDGKGIRIDLIDKPNGGVSSARNAGMRASRGVYIALLDSDDEWYVDKIEQQVKIMSEHKDIDLLGTTRNREVFKRFFFKKFSRLNVISARLLLYKNFFSPPTVLLKRKILEETGFFDESQRYAEEGNYFIRVCNNHKCVLLNQSLATTGKGKPNFGFSGLSSNLKEMEKGELKNLKDAYNLGVVGGIEYIFLVCYSILKYFRRLLVVKLRQ
jgi:glycosyltransferase involved in cell wall biosynthesis